MLYLRHFPAAGAPLIGGTATAVAGLARGLAENGASVTVLCEGDARRSTPLSSGWRVECFPACGHARSFALSSSLKQYVQRHLAARGGLCLLNGMFHPGSYALGAFLHEKRLPYVVAPHDPYEPAVFKRNAHLKWPYWYLFERRLLARARAVQLLDERHAHSLRRLGIRTRTIEAPNGFSPDAVPAGPSLRPPTVAGPVQAAFLGRLDAYNKGLDLLLDAVAEVAASAPIRLVLQGPEWGDRACLERRSRTLRIQDFVEFRAPDYRRAPVQILGAHDVLCLPSRFEGFGLAALEAMLAARVLLVSERAGIARHVLASGAGVTVAPTVQGVAEGLRRLLACRATWPSMGMDGRSYVLRNLRWRDIAASALADYARILD